MWYVLRRPVATCDTGARRQVLLLLSTLWCALGAGCTDSPTALPSRRLVVQPEVDTLTRIGDTVHLTATVGSGEMATGISWTTLTHSVATVDSLGTVRAVAAGTALIVAAASPESDMGGAVADTATVVVQIGFPSAVPMSTDPQWTVNDNGAFVDVRGTVLRVKFAYDATGREGWFIGGGGRDGGIVELYYLPTSPTRNLVFRNGTYGGKLDNLDYFQANGASTDQQGHNTPDFTSGVHAQPISHRVWESAGRVFAEFDFQFVAWRIQRTYILYPWGDITVHSRLTQTQAGEWSYLGHSFQFAVSSYDFQNRVAYAWGGSYESDGESLHAWSDSYANGIPSDGAPYEYSDVIRQGLNRNTAISMFGRFDPYSGFMLDDRNGNDPDVIVMNGDSATFFSPVDRIARAVGGKAYVETGIFTAPWAPDSATHSGINWFYSTTPCCPVQYDNPMLWPTSLGTWEEAFHIFFRQNLDPVDYLPMWRARARELGREVPRVVGNAQVRLDPTDRLYHITAAPGAQSVQFTWVRSSAASRSVNYHTAFVIENFPNGRVALVDGSPSLHARAYRDPTTGSILVQLDGAEPATPTAYTITVTP